IPLWRGGGITIPRKRRASPCSPEPSTPRRSPMKRLLLGGLLLAALALAAYLPGATAEDKKADDKGWVQLFNGKDLTGWKTHPKTPGRWEVNDGVLSGRGKDVSHLFSERGDYTNFHYRLEAKINDKGNSGQYFR